ncbi:MAG TPA: hypothetical protein VGY97_03390 [Solirubrobacteraceae bacterium]|nr:hypothetical protein [Solirubrobacteraceae bacterium]
MTTSNGGTNDPLSANTWTQQPTEIDELAWGSVSVTNPSSGSCTNGGGFGPLATVNVSIDGKPPVSFTTVAPAAGSSQTSVIDLTTAGFFGNAANGKVFESGSSTPHTVTATVSDNCSSGSLHVTSLGFDVLGIA